MKTSHALRAGAVVIAALACLTALASPASATVHTYNVTMESGRITVGSINFDTPGSGATGCTTPPVGGTAITGTINDAATTDNITGTLTISSLFNVAPFPPFYTGGNFALTVTGSATGTNAGNYNATTGTFTQLAFTNLSYTIRTVSSCTATTTVVCSGTAALTASGGLNAGSTLPLSASETVFVNATGTITSRNTPCTLPFSIIITTGTGLSLSDNPNDDWGPDTDSDGDADPDGITPDPGAIFHQVT